MAARDPQGVTAPQVVFTVNGPGEISAWLWPLATELRRQRPDLRLAAFLLPCVFSSGAEARVLREIGAVDTIATIRESWRAILTGRMPEGVARGGPTLLMHLGGEPALSLALARRLGAPSMAYADHALGFSGRFDRLFASGLVAREGRLPGEPVGELMVDAAGLRRAQAPARPAGRRRIALFPGSRDYFVRPLLPYYAVSVDAIAADHPEVEWVMARSDYVSLDLLAALDRLPEDRSWRARALTLHRDDGPYLLTEGGTRIDVLTGAQALATADLALTIPGTSTGELAASGIPMVVVVPTYLGHEVPLPGLAGHVGRIPVVGKSLKIALGHQVLRRMNALSQPNRRAGEALVPEIVGRDLHGRIQTALRALLERDTADLSDSLRAAMGSGGAAVRLASEISQALPPR